MGRRKGRCVYCGFAGGLTDEHVLPTFSGLLPEGGRFETFTTAADGKPVRHFESVEQLGLVAHVVCGPCNHGWMERLETRVRAYLVPMITGRQATLDPSGDPNPGRWLAKTHQMYRINATRADPGHALALGQGIN